VRPWARVAATLAAVVAADQATKALVRRDITLGSSRDALPGVDLVHVRNKGVAFGLFAGGGPVVLALVAAALALLVVYFARHPRRPLLWLPTGLLLGGAAGNLIDRARDGAVTDFVKLPAWPAFNLADAAITIGVVLLVWVIELRPRA
jgi:signal peptidase II